MRELGFAPAEAGVYVSRWHHGSPAHRYSLYALHWLTQLNGQPVPDLDAFVAIVKTLPDKSFARLKLCQLETTKTKVSFACSCLLSITVSVIELVVLILHTVILCAVSHIAMHFMWLGFISYFLVPSC